jgi:hypothetical protein
LKFIAADTIIFNYPFSFAKTLWVLAWGALRALHFIHIIVGFVFAHPSAALVAAIEIRSRFLFSNTQGCFHAIGVN